MYQLGGVYESLVLTHTSTNHIPKELKDICADKLGKIPTKDWIKSIKKHGH